MKKEEEHWNVLDVLGLTKKEKSDVIEMIRRIVHTVIDRHFGFTKARKGMHND